MSFVFLFTRSFVNVVKLLLEVVVVKVISRDVKPSFS